MTFFNSMVFRVLALIILLVLLTFPVSMLEGIVDKQITDQNNVTQQLTNQWGNEQTIIGPILSIPYVERISRIESQTDSNGVRSSVSKDIFNNKTLMLLPENLNIQADLKDKLLIQKQYQTHVYQGDVTLSGNFNLESLPEASGFNTIEWDRAFVAIGLSDNKSVEASAPFRWEGSSAMFKPGTQLPALMKHGFHANLEEVANENDLPKFKIQLNLKGNHTFKFAPFGELTSATIKSDYAQVKVQGDIPASSKVSSTDDFEATWRISNLVRNYPQQWLIEENTSTAIDYDFSSVLTGVELLPKLQDNDKNLFKIKTIQEYILIILGILFLSLVILEFKRNSRSKPKFIHYLVVSLPILLLPIMLLTLNGLIDFDQAYQIGSGTSILLIVMYVLIALKSFGRAFYILLILASLYAALYVNLQLPEYSLYAFSVAGLFITALLMMASFNIHEDE